MECFRDNLLEATRDLLTSLQNSTTTNDTVNCSIDSEHHIVPECYNCVLIEEQCSILQAKVLVLEKKNGHPLKTTGHLIKPKKLVTQHTME